MKRTILYPLLTLYLLIFSNQDDFPFAANENKDKP